MMQTFTDSGGATVGAVLAFVDGAAKRGDDAAVPSSCLEVLTRHAACAPEASGFFVFRTPSAAEQPSGWCERALAALLLVALSPVFLAVALAVLLFDGAPVVFRQERYGFGGRAFTVFKFRTMVRRSEELHEELQRQMGQDGRLFKLEHDPRVTPLGSLLRRTFLDELPQLLNVARGEMRFVGPRPLPASDQGHYTQPHHALRLKGMPGLTGLWQVAGRNERTFDEMCLLDYYYLCNRSLAFDLSIIARTVGVVFKEIGLKRKA